MIDPSTAETLFQSLFLPLYSKEARLDLSRTRSEDANPAKNPAVLRALEETALVFSKLAPSLFGDLDLDGSDASIHRLSAALDQPARDRLILADGPDGAPLLATVVIHAAAYIGAAIVRHHGGEWLVRSPLWESRVRVVSRAGEAEVAPFSWLVRALSDAELGGASLGDRYRTHIEVPCAKPEDLPIFVRGERRLPRLQKPRYDTLHKYIVAHLPELSDLGADFPSPERFADLAFGFLDFVVLGEGRMVLMHGPSEEGAYLIWLDQTGFTKSAYFPCDAFPAHKVEVDGDKVRLLAPLLGKTVTHEMLWWGP